MKENGMKHYVLKRDVPMEDGYDMVVSGAGPAGVSAAVCAARLGARVLLVEATGALGGMGTSGLVTAFDPMADGEKMLVGGFMREVVETLYERGFLGPQVTPDFWLKEYHRWVPFSSEGLKLVLDESTQDAGVEVRFFTRLIDVDVSREDKTVDGVILHNIEGYRYVKAKTFIDATGDAVLADLCGAECRVAGRDTENIMPGTLTSLHAGIDWEKCNWTIQQKALAQAIDDGHFSQPDRHLPGLTRVGKGVGYLNGGHVFNLDALRCKSLSDGMVRGRKIAQEYAEFFRKYVPGCGNIELITTAALMGIRESRRIVGEYELTIDDYMARRQFPDQIGVFNKFVDIHAYNASEEEWERCQNTFTKMRISEGECFGLPYRMLVPKGWKNLWVAGRCASSDVLANGSIRVMPAAGMMGQAAGTAAVQAIETKRTACEIDTDSLTANLRRQGAYLP